MLKPVPKILTFAVLSTVFIGCWPHLGTTTPQQQAISEPEPSPATAPITDAEPEKAKQTKSEISPDKVPTESEQTTNDTPTEKPAPDQQIIPEPQAEPENKSKKQETKELPGRDKTKEKQDATKDSEEEPDLIKPDKPRKPAFYEKCNFIFTTYVDQDGLVDYDTLRRKRLDLILAAKEFDSIQPFDMMTWSQNEKLALWLNAYNIFTLKLIVDNYPIQPRWYMITYPDESIMQIPGAWTKNYFEVMGIEYTLREIEREILLERFRDPRICFALSYATLGGAILRNEVYLPEKLDDQLDEQVKKYLASPRGLKIDHTNKVIYLSNIFSSYRNIFIEKYADIKKFRSRKPHERACLNFISKYAHSDIVKYFESDRYIVKFLQYDWQLNEQPRK